MFNKYFFLKINHQNLKRTAVITEKNIEVDYSTLFNNIKSYSNKYYWLFFLICLQGFIGWYMVSSGLIENNDVNHFRLSIHLSLALFILCLIFWFILNIINVSIVQFFCHFALGISVKYTHQDVTHITELK